MKKIGVLVSGGGTNLQAILDAQEKGIIKSGKVSVVVSSSAKAYALERAKNAGVPGVCVSKKECLSRAEFEEKIIAALDEYEIDYIVLAGFMHILSSDFIKKYERKNLSTLWRKIHLPSRRRYHQMPMRLGATNPRSTPIYCRELQ